MDTLSYKTISEKESNVERNWYVVDAKDQVLGRICSQIAHILKGKNKPSYTPHTDCGDNIIVINADKVKLTGNKLSKKTYLSYSLYPGGQKSITAKELMDKKPTAVVERAVKGMLPKNKLGAAMFKKLFVYEGAEHKHEAQQPQELKF